MEDKKEKYVSLPYEEFTKLQKLADTNKKKLIELRNEYECSLHDFMTRNDVIFREESNRHETPLFDYRVKEWSWRYNPSNNDIHDFIKKTFGFESIVHNELDGSTIITADGDRYMRITDDVNGYRTLMSNMKREIESLECNISELKNSNTLWSLIVNYFKTRRKL